MSNKNNEKNGFFKIKNYGDKLTYEVSVRPMIIDLKRIKPCQPKTYNDSRILLNFHKDFDVFISQIANELSISKEEAINTPVYLPYLGYNDDYTGLMCRSFETAKEAFDYSLELDKEINGI